MYILLVWSVYRKIDWYVWQVKSGVEFSVQMTLHFQKPVFRFFPITEPRSCKISKEELADGLQVLFFKEGLFYEAKVKAIQAPDM